MLLEAWESEITAPTQATILPDGCQDLLFIALPGQAPRWEITTLDDAPYRIDMARGTYFKGFRLRAGVRINGLRAAMQGLPPDHSGIEDRLNAFTTLDPLVEDALSALAEQTVAGGKVANAAAAMGVHQRQVQRAMAQQTGRSAAQWLALARVRKAARAVAMGEELAEVAYDTGYADQPHMNRAFRQWLGTTPKNAPVLSLGYG
ncbi:MAG: helix-turn-helix domain-containing protein [Rhodobacteraceae bacterium]|nr:helix-turn-helix domain-containing protein [Paracoccaceae bacterium]